MRFIAFFIFFLFSSYSFAEFKSTDKDIGKLLIEGFKISKIDTIGEDNYIYHLKKGLYIIAICNIIQENTNCIVDDEAYMEKFGE